MVLTLDPSLRAFGWAIVSNGKYVAGGCVKTKKKKGLIVDSDYISLRELIEALMDLNKKYKITEVYYEVPGGSKGFRCAQTLAAVRGAVLSFCLNNALPHNEVRVIDLRKELVGNKDASKDEILACVLKKIPTFSVKGLKDDEKYAISDALAVYLGGKEIKKNVRKNKSS